MMIRLYKKETDFDELMGLCESRGIDFPLSGAIYVFEDSRGRIVGVIALKQEFFIEPLIAENPLVGNSLFSFLEGFISGLGLDHVRAVCREDKEGLFNKAGFKVIESSKIIMEKHYG